MSEKLEPHNKAEYEATKENIKKQYNIPDKHLKKIIKEYGGIENFIEKFKRGECDWTFKGDIFVGERVITLSEKDITVGQKRAYCDLAKSILGRDELLFEQNQYIDIDAINTLLEGLDDAEKDMITERFGLDTGKALSPVNASDKYGISRQAYNNRVRKVLSKIQDIIKKSNGSILVNGEKDIEEELNTIQQVEAEMKLMDELLMFAYKNAFGEEKSLDELGFHIDEELRTILEREFAHTWLPWNTTNDLYWDLLRLEEYYIMLCRIVKDKEDILTRKKIQEKFDIAKEEYLMNEDIFDENYIIKGIDWKNIKQEKGNPKGKRIEELNLYPSTIVTLHYYGISTMDDFANISNIEEFLDSSGRVSFFDKNHIIRTLVSEGYLDVKLLSDKWQREWQKVMKPKSIFLKDMGFSTRAWNSICRFGMSSCSLSELLNNFENEEVLMRRLRIGYKGLEEIKDKVHSYGFKFIFEEEQEHEEEKEEASQPLVEDILAQQKKIKSQESEIAELRAQRRSFDEQ